jgi:octaprenyl-diphosphate synthase
MIAKLQEASFTPENPADLAALSRFVADDLVAVEATLNTLYEAPADVITRSAIHLLALPGKRLRPLCVALAARIGDGFGGAARCLATAVELVHSATLLHDDVVDLGNVRRGQPTARTIYGNAASVFAGDWLLIEALRQVRRSRVPGTLDELLSVIEEMIRAEAIQLEARGTITADRETYFSIVRGKTASLFRWALFAGARAGGLEPSVARALERYGEHLGIAFQIIDDALDLSGDAATLGKSLFTDLHEGKMTYPLIVAIERDPELIPVLEAAISDSSDETIPARVLASLRRTGACASALELAKSSAQKAIEELAAVPACQARDLLALVAEATTERRK